MSEAKIVYFDAFFSFHKQVNKTKKTGWTNLSKYTKTKTSNSGCFLQCDHSCMFKLVVYVPAKIGVLTREALIH